MTSYGMTFQLTVLEPLDLWRGEGHDPGLQLQRLAHHGLHVLQLLGERRLPWSGCNKHVSEKLGSISLYYCSRSV